MMLPRSVLMMFWAGFTAEEKDVKGTITVPEVAHDTDEDEYVVGSLGHPRSMIDRDWR